MMRQQTGVREHFRLRQYVLTLFVAQHRKLRERIHRLDS